MAGLASVQARTCVSALQHTISKKLSQTENVVSQTAQVQGPLVLIRAPAWIIKLITKLDHDVTV